MSKRLLVMALLWAVSAAAQPAVPTKVNFTARLVDNGTPVTGTRNLVFSLYPTLMGGSPVWTETRNNVTVTDGAVNVDLGASTPLTDSILDGQTLYLEVTVGTQVLTPRTAVLSAPYAVRSTVAARVGTLQEADIQKRVGSTCSPGSAIRTINADGTVVCQASAAVADAGVSITSVNAGAGLTGGGATGDVTLSVAFSGSGSAATAARSDHAHAGVYLPVGMSRTCMTGQKVTGIGTDGNVTCTADTVYDVVANGGLTRSATNQFSLMSCSTGQQLIATSLGWGCTNPLGVQSLSVNSPLVLTGTASNPTLSLNVVPVGNGGTNATAPAQARTNLGAAASGANSDITSLSGLSTPLSASQGGTGMGTPTAGAVRFLKSNTTGGWTLGTVAPADLPTGVPVWTATPSCPVGQVLRAIDSSGNPTCVKDFVYGNWGAGGTVFSDQNWRIELTTTSPGGVQLFHTDTGYISYSLDNGDGSPAFGNTITSGVVANKPLGAGRVVRVDVSRGDSNQGTWYHYECRTAYSSIVTCRREIH